MGRLGGHSDSQHVLGFSQPIFVLIRHSFHAIPQHLLQIANLTLGSHTDKQFEEVVFDHFHAVAFQGGSNILVFHHHHVISTIILARPASGTY